MAPFIPLVPRALSERALDFPYDNFCLRASPGRNFVCHGKPRMFALPPTQGEGIFLMQTQNRQCMNVSRRLKLGEEEKTRTEQVKKISAFPLSKY
jgi:hypothetical protein